MWFLPGLVLAIASRTCPALFNLLCKTTGFGCDDAQKIAITKIITEVRYVLPSPTPTAPIQTTSTTLRNSPAISSLAALIIILGLPLLLCLILLFRYSSISLSWPIERNSRLETSERTIEHLKSRLHRLTISNFFNTAGRALEVSMKVAEIRRLALLNLALHAKNYTLNLRWEASGRTIQKLKQCIKGLQHKSRIQKISSTRSIKQEITRLKQEITRLTRANSKLHIYNRSLKFGKSHDEDKIVKLTKELTALQIQLQKQNHDEDKIAELTKQLTTLQEQQQKEREEFEVQLHLRDGTESACEQEIERLRQALQNKDVLIHDLQANVNRNQEIARLQRLILDKDTMVKYHREKADKIEDQVRQVRSAAVNSKKQEEEEIARLGQALLEKDVVIHNLREEATKHSALDKSKEHDEEVARLQHALLEKDVAIYNVREEAIRVEKDNQRLHSAPEKSNTNDQEVARLQQALLDKDISMRDLHEKANKAEEDNQRLHSALEDSDKYTQDQAVNIETLQTQTYSLHLRSQQLEEQLSKSAIMSKHPISAVILEDGKIIKTKSKDRFKKRKGQDKRAQAEADVMNNGTRRRMSISEGTPTQEIARNILSKTPFFAMAIPSLRGRKDELDNMVEIEAKVASALSEIKSKDCAQNSGFSALSAADKAVFTTTLLAQSTTDLLVPSSLLLQPITTTSRVDTLWTQPQFLSAAGLAQSQKVRADTTIRTTCKQLFRRLQDVYELVPLDAPREGAAQSFCPSARPSSAVCEAVDSFVGEIGVQLALDLACVCGLCGVFGGGESWEVDCPRAWAERCKRKEERERKKSKGKGVAQA